MFPIVFNNVPVEMVCLQENVVLHWDILKYSKIDYAYIKHGRELIVTIAPLTHFTIEDEFKSQVQINITEPLQIEMTIFNVTKATNGTYTCTIGVQGKQEHIIKKEISVIDPDITLSLDTDYNNCKTLNCSSKHQVALLGPNKTENKTDTCLFKEHNGMYSCCLVNQSMCSLTYCKYIDVNLDEHNDIHHSRNKEKKTPSDGLDLDFDFLDFDYLDFDDLDFDDLDFDDIDFDDSDFDDLDKQNTEGVNVKLIETIVTILILLAIIIGIWLIKVTKCTTYKRRRNDQNSFTKRTRRPDATATVELFLK